MSNSPILVWAKSNWVAVSAFLSAIYLSINQWNGFFRSCPDLELSDFMSSSPCLNARTPGQLLSLTSHLSFGSGELKMHSKSRISECAATVNLLNTINQQSKYQSVHSHSYRMLIRFFNCITIESPMFLDSSTDERNCSRVSGVTPFFSSEDIHVSASLTNNNESVSQL